MDYAQLRDIAEQAVDMASAQLELHKTGDVETRFKLSGEEVTDADLQVQDQIGTFLHQSTPEIPLIGEESPSPQGVESISWVLDPIDGTMNFARGAPYYAISLALVDNFSPVIGVVSAPKLALRVAASAVSESIEKPQTVPLSRALIGITGTGSARSQVDADLVRDLHLSSYRVRLHGSMCLDVVGVALGWLDGCVCVRPKPWDVAAGIAIAKSRGYVAIGRDGTDFTWTSPLLIVGTPELAMEVSDVVADRIGPLS